MAINNIERVENLERCESLEKLDLTLNFIGDLESICSLQKNINLKQLYLTGNPCTDFKGYRNYIIVKLPQLETLDNIEITRSERIKVILIKINKIKVNYCIYTLQISEFWFNAVSELLNYLKHCRLNK